MIGIVNYGMGNIGSIKHKLDGIGVNSIISSEPDVLHKCDKLILPGVGHFAQAMSKLYQGSMIDFLNEFVISPKKWVLGICLGMQLFANHSEEGNVNGLGWIDAEVIRFRIRSVGKYKVPHIGWNDVKIHQVTSLFNDVTMANGFYFVHAYHMICHNSSDILCETCYENLFVSAVMKNNIIGLQFHPEKSHDAGERVLRNFVEL